MEPRIPIDTGVLGATSMDVLSYQQNVQMQEFKYNEHLKELEKKWAKMKDELEKLPKGWISPVITT